MGEKSAKKTVKYYSDITACEVDWFWYPYIPYGKITLVQGDPGIGKSSMVLNLLALASTGERMPDGKNHPAVVSIYQCLEDSLEDTIKPRLEAFGADCTKIAFIPESPDDPLFLSDERIAKAISDAGARILVIDPIQSYFGKDADINRMDRARTILNRLNLIASSFKCAVILVGHMNKSESSNVLYRGLGSIDMVAIARSVLQVHRSKNDCTIRVMSQVKSNLSQEGSDFAFRRNGNRFTWIGETDEDGELLKEKVRKSDKATGMLLGCLTGKDASAVEIEKLIGPSGIGRRTFMKAKAELGIQSIKKADGWYWHLPIITEPVNTVDESTGGDYV